MQNDQENSEEYQRGTSEDQEGFDEATREELQKMKGSYESLQKKAASVGFQSPEEYQLWLEDEAYRNIQDDENKALSQETTPNQQQNRQKPEVRQRTQRPNPPQQPQPQQPQYDQQSALAMLEAQYSSYLMANQMEGTKSPYKKDEMMNVLRGPEAGMIGKLSRRYGNNVWKAAEKFLDMDSGNVRQSKKDKDNDDALASAQRTGSLQSGTTVSPPSASGKSNLSNAEQLANEIAPDVGGYQKNS
ncbi:MAG: hypothetical protein U9N61_11095 [Euryarchaeota archaeon]|nr:hypothetical protein [Euryarchaeota archaeon]